MHLAREGREFPPAHGEDKARPGLVTPCWECSPKLWCFCMHSGVEEAPVSSLDLSGLFAGAGNWPAPQAECGLRGGQETGNQEKCEKWLMMRKNPCREPHLQSQVKLFLAGRGTGMSWSSSPSWCPCQAGSTGHQLQFITPWVWVHHRHHHQQSWPCSVLFALPPTPFFCLTPAKSIQVFLKCIESYLQVTRIPNINCSKIFLTWVQALPVCHHWLF